MSLACWIESTFRAAHCALRTQATALDWPGLWLYHYWQVHGHLKMAVPAHHCLTRVPETRTQRSLRGSRERLQQKTSLQLLRPPLMIMWWLRQDLQFQTRLYMRNWKKKAPPQGMGIHKKCWKRQMTTAMGLIEWCEEKSWEALYCSWMKLCHS